MHSEAYVQLALELLSCNQKELAQKMGVSPTQISKWKKGDYLSFEMEGKLRKLINIENLQPDFILIAGSIKNAKKWERLIRFIAEVSSESSETGYNTEPLLEENELLPWSTFHTLSQLGITIPKEFPQELDVDLEDPNLEWDFIEENPISFIIKKIFLSLNDVYGFYAAYISDLIYGEGTNLIETSAENIEPCLIELAASKVKIDESIATNLQKFRQETLSNYQKWISEVKDFAFRAGIPLRAELLDLVYKTHDEVGHNAEAESLGFNKSRLHPDIYMNELLVGMRMIHQVLPAILKKLEIEDDFEIDVSNLHLSKHRPE